MLATEGTLRRTAFTRISDYRSWAQIIQKEDWVIVFLIQCYCTQHGGCPRLSRTLVNERTDVQYNKLQ